MSNIALGTSATQILAATSTVFPITAITVTNLGANTIYLGPAAVTTATGLPVAANGTIRLAGGLNNGLYGVAATAAQTSPADTRYFTEPTGS